MGLLMWMRAATEATHAADEIARPNPIRTRWTVDVEEFGLARCQVATGDIDGSGETPGVQLEIEHEYTRGPVAIALSGREAELASRALAQAAEKIKPSERLKARRSKWRREELGITTNQPKSAGISPPERVYIESPQQAEALYEALQRVKDPRLKSIEEQLEIPF